jgi:hypothetical protein
VRAGGGQRANISNQEETREMSIMFVKFLPKCSGPVVVSDKLPLMPLQTFLCPSTTTSSKLLEFLVGQGGTSSSSNVLASKLSKGQDENVR